VSRLLGPMAQNERGWGGLSEAQSLLSRACEEQQQRDSLAKRKIKYGTVLGMAHDREEVAES
jgi:hypothetical protein